MNVNEEKTGLNKITVNFSYANKIIVKQNGTNIYTPLNKLTIVKQIMDDIKHNH